MILITHRSSMYLLWIKPLKGEKEKVQIFASASYGWKKGGRKVRATDAVASHSAAAHRFLQVSLGQITPSLVFWSVRYRDQPQVNLDLGPGRRLEPRHCLQVVDTLTDHRWSRSAEGKPTGATWQQRCGATVVAAITTRVKNKHTNIQPDLPDAHCCKLCSTISFTVFFGFYRKLLHWRGLTAIFRI